MKVKDLVVLSLLAGILFVQEEVLTFLPNIQLTVFLLVLYSKQLGRNKTLLIILIHVMLDNLVYGGMNPIVMTFMFIGWALIPILLSTVFKHIEDSFKLACLGILFAFLYSWIFIIPSVIIYHMAFIPYLMADFLFEILLAASSFITILWLYDPCKKIFTMYLK